MPLPNIDIQFENGNLGGFAPSPDGLMCLVTHLVPASGHNVVFGAPYLLTGMADLLPLGITEAVLTQPVYKAIREFYQEAGEGTPLWFFAINGNLELSSVFTPNGSGEAPIETVLKAANGNIRGLIICYNVFTTSTWDIVDGMYTDVWPMLNAASNFAENYAASDKAPFFVIVDGFGFQGDHTELPDLTEMAHNRCAVLIGDTDSRNGTPQGMGSAVGIIGGRIAKNPVHVNIGKVLDGPVSAPQIFIVNEDAAMYNIAALHDKGYISFRQWIGKAGYYFTDDKLACEVSDDYHHLTNRRVIDKAYRIAYTTLLDTMLAEIPVNSNGTIQTPFAKSIENRVQSAIFNQMTAQGELSADQANPNDIGVRFTVDLTNNVIASSQVKGVLRVRPFGYNRFFDVLLGFDINAN